MVRYLTQFLALAGLVLAQETQQSTPPRSYPKSVQLSYELLGSSASSSQPLATVEYDPKTFESVLSSWTPPFIDTLQSTSQEPTSSPLLRVLLPNGSATVTGLAAFDTKLSQDIDIWISLENGGEVVSASVRSSTPPPLSAEEERQRQKEERLRKRGKTVPSPKAKPKPKPKAKSTAKKVKDAVVGEIQGGPQIRVNILPVGYGPTPKLNSRAPPQLDADGREIVPEEQQEKTFFQKYWFILLGIAFMLMTSGAGKE